LVDPELMAVIDKMPRFMRSSDINQTAVRVSRLLFAVMAALPRARSSKGATCQKLHIPGPEGASKVRVLVYRPLAAKGPLPALLDIHGGGYVLGNPEQDDKVNRMLCSGLGIVVVSVDYRLAPAHPYPSGVEDCYAALAWMHREAAQLGIDKARIAIKGESAGGGMAAALAQLARDRAKFPIVFQLLVYPMLDDRTGSTVKPDLEVGEFIWTAGSNRFGWHSLLGKEPGGEDTPPYASAARAKNLAGLPPCFTCVGSLDLFRDETIDYAERLKKAGVPTELRIYPGAVHGFNAIMPKAQLSHTYNADQIEALRKGLSLPTKG
jgi:acetyl esterase/lipase